MIRVIDRKMFIPPNDRVVAFVGDDKIKIVTFGVRKSDLAEAFGTDISGVSAGVVTKKKIASALNGVYCPLTKTGEQDGLVLFDWTVSSGFTSVTCECEIQFQAQIGSGTSAKVYNSEVNVVIIGRSVDASGEDYDDDQLTPFEKIKQEIINARTGIDMIADDLRDYVDDALGGKYDKTGGTISGNVAVLGQMILLPNGAAGMLSLSKGRLNGLYAPTADADAANKKYVDDTKAEAVEESVVYSQRAVAPFDYTDIEYVLTGDGKEPKTKKLQVGDEQGYYTTSGFAFLEEGYTKATITLFEPNVYVSAYFEGQGTGGDYDVTYNGVKVNQLHNLGRDNPIRLTSPIVIESTKPKTRIQLFTPAIGVGVGGTISATDKAKLDGAASASDLKDLAEQVQTKVDGAYTKAQTDAKLATKLDKVEGGQIDGDLIIEGYLNINNDVSVNGANISLMGTTQLSGTATLNGAPVATTADITAEHSTMKTYVDTALDGKLDKSGGVLTGDLDVSWHSINVLGESGSITISPNGSISGIATVSGSTDAVNKGYVDTTASQKLDKSGGTMTGNLSAGGHRVTDVGMLTFAGESDGFGDIYDPLIDLNGFDVEVANGKLFYSSYTTPSDNGELICYKQMKDYVDEQIASIVSAPSAEEATF